MLEVIAVPAFAILLLGPSRDRRLPALLAILLLADIGLATVGALVAALAAEARARDLLVPLLLLPAARAGADRRGEGHRAAVGRTPQHTGDLGQMGRGPRRSTIWYSCSSR